MLYYKDTPDDCKEEYDELVFRAIAKLAEDNVCTPEVRLSDIIFDSEEYQLPECFFRNGQPSKLTESLFEIMVGLIKYGATEQRHHQTALFYK